MNEITRIFGAAFPAAVFTLLSSNSFANNIIVHAVTNPTGGGGPTVISSVNANGVGVGQVAVLPSYPIRYDTTTQTYDLAFSNSVLNQLGPNNGVDFWAISDSGHIAGNYKDTSNQRWAFVVDLAGNVTILPTVNGLSNSEAKSVNANGTVCGAIINADDQVQACFWEPPYAVVNTITMPGDIDHSIATSISGNNVIVGRVRNPDPDVQFRGFVDQIGDGDPIDIVEGPDRNLGIQGISDDGGQVAATLGSGARTMCRVSTYDLQLQIVGTTSLWTESTGIGGEYEKTIVGLFRHPNGPVELKALVWNACSGQMTMPAYLASLGADAATIATMDEYSIAYDIDRSARFICGSGTLNGQPMGWIVEID